MSNQSGTDTTPTTRARSATGGVAMNGEIDYDKIFGEGFIVVDPTDRVDLNDVIPCLPQACPPFVDLFLKVEEAPAAEAAEAPCTCHRP